ncbi:MAG TPA: hypothetical protein VM713_09480, partial [Steroidobacteraceae bacterium]|nr:hypothetical protein [Steroidobacteraceae bacterium]
MSGSRREFPTTSCAVLLAPGAAAAGTADPTPTPTSPAEPPPGSPPAFGTSPPVGPEVSAATFADAEKLVMVELTAAECAQAAENWRSSMATIHERRSGPRKVALPPTLAPYSTWNPLLPGQGALPQAERFLRSERDAGPLPAADA